MGLPLSGLRIVATLPPDSWFGGVDYNFAVEMAEELRAMGATVFQLDVGGFAVRNEYYIEEAVRAMKSFRPDLAISLPNAVYALHCRTLRGSYIFRDVLDIPTVMLWE